MTCAARTRLKIVNSTTEKKAKQESWDKMKSKTITRMENKNRPEKDKLTAESEENETAMMCWEI